MLQSFFINGDVPGAEHGTYSPVLVALSYLVASAASYLALSLARRLAVQTNKNKQRAWIYVGGSLALGAGIWSMHFIGMMAFKMNMPMDYNPWMTVLSLAFAIASAFGVLFLVGRNHLSHWQIVCGALILGIGIAGMHYIGMTAMIMPADIRYRPDMFGLSVLIAIASSGAALWLCFRIARHNSGLRRKLEIIAALAMGAAICGMHYTGMAAAIFLPHDCGHMTIGDDVNSNGNGIVLIIAAIGIILCLIAPITIYREVQDEDDQDRVASIFPAKLLMMSMYGSLAAFMVIVGYSLYSNYVLKIDGDTADALGRFNGIAYGTALVILVLIPAQYSSLYNVRVWRQTLRRNKQLLDTILDNMPLGLFAKDVQQDYKYVMLNKTLQRALGMNTESNSYTDYDLFPKHEADSFRRIDERVMAEGKLVDVEAETVTTPGGSFISHTLKVPIYDADSKPYLLLGMYEDVTERIHAKEELRDAKERAEKADQTKSEFLANMSHELRTPLNSIMGMTRLMMGRDMAEEHKETLKIIHQSSAQLLELVNDILDLSKIEANQVELEQIGFDPAYTAESTFASLKHFAEEKHLKLYAKTGPLPYIVGDPTRLSRIFINLIGNGIKYTDRGSVGVSTTCEPLTPGRILLTFKVMDTGIGIPPEKIDSVFDKFVQADTSTTRRYGGTGLGLAITKQLVEIMGGGISVESEPEHGSTFTVRIPFATTDQLEERPSVKRVRKLCGTLPAASARVLIAEDHAMNKIFMSKLLQDFGILNFEIADNGQLALQAYKRQNWDLILMDCHMPELSGYEATEAIRSLERDSGKYVPIIAMTANAMVGDREKCLRHGMDDYISKPINYEELKSILAQWLKFDDTVHGTAAPKPTGKHVDLSILETLAEDKELIKRLAKSFILQSDENIAGLQKNCVDGDSVPWTEAAHMLKGGARQIGAEGLGELAFRAQEMQLASLQDRQDLLAAITTEYALVCAELKAEAGN